MNSAVNSAHDPAAEPDPAAYGFLRLRGGRAPRAGCC